MRGHKKIKSFLIGILAHLSILFLLAPMECFCEWRNSVGRIHGSQSNILNGKQTKKKTTQRVDFNQAEVFLGFLESAGRGPITAEMVKQVLSSYGSGDPPAKYLPNRYK